jgi:hypothetical protein
MDLTERQEEILKAVFDNFIKKEVIEKKFITNKNDLHLGEPDLNIDYIDCKSEDLYNAIMASYCRIKSEVIPKKSIEEEILIDRVMFLVVKEQLKQLTVTPLGFPRYLKNIVDQLNEENRDLNVNIKELMDFIHPIYLDGIKEILHIA